MHLSFEDKTKQIKKALTEPLFERLIEKYILNNTQGSMVMLPKPGPALEKEKEVLNKLNAYKETLQGRNRWDH